MASYDATIRLLADISPADKALDRLQSKIQAIKKASTIAIRGPSDASPGVKKQIEGYSTLISLLERYKKGLREVPTLTKESIFQDPGKGPIGDAFRKAKKEVADLSIALANAGDNFKDVFQTQRESLGIGKDVRNYANQLEFAASILGRIREGFKANTGEARNLEAAIRNIVNELQSVRPGSGLTTEIQSAVGPRTQAGLSGPFGIGAEQINAALEQKAEQFVRLQQKQINNLSQINRLRKAGLNVNQADTLVSAAGEQLRKGNVTEAAKLVKEAEEELRILSRVNGVLRRNRNERRRERIQQGRSRQRRASTSPGRIAVGAAFPALFGGGPGAILGGGIGEAFGPLGGVVGSAIGQQFDQLIEKAAAIGNALQNATSNMEGLRDAGISVTAELEAQVRLLNRYGDAQEAQQRIQEAVFTQTGDVGGQATRLAAGSVNELQKAWEGVSAATAAALGIIGAPFIQAITLILRGVQAILVGFNAIVTATTSLINLIPGAKALGDALYESSVKGTAEYEKRQNELEKETETLARAVSEQQKYNTALRNAGQLRNTEFKLSKQILDYRAKERQSIEAILNKQEELGGGRTGEERLRIEKQLNTFRTLEYAKLTQIRLENEREVVTAQENNIRRINDINEDTARTYRDMRIQLERQIEDERINAVRRVEDAQLKAAKAVLDFRERELRLIQNQRQEQLKVSAALGQLEALFTAAPEREGIAAQLTAAVQQYKNGIAEADENRKITEAKIQLDAREAALAVERYKQDNARRVARINEDSTRKIADINNKLDKQRIESFKYAYDLTVQRLIAQETAAKGQLEQRIAGEKALMQSPFADDLYKQAANERIKQIQAEIKAIDNSITRLQNLASKLPKTPNIQGMGALPQLTSQTSEVSAEETALNSVLEKGRERLSQLEQENSKQREAVKLALSYLNQVEIQGQKQAGITESLNRRNRDGERYLELLQSGINPELAKQMVSIESASQGVKDVIDLTVNQLKALNDPKFKELIDKLLALRAGQEGVVSSQIAAAKDNKALEDATVKAEKLKQIYTDLKENVVQRLAVALEDALVSTIEAAVTGAKDLGETLQNIASTLLKDLGRMFIRAGIQGLGTSMGLPGFADGGTVMPGNTYMVGERGPELLQLNRNGSGKVINNNQLSSAMGRYRRSSGNASPLDQMLQEVQGTSTGGASGSNVTYNQYGGNTTNGTIIKSASDPNVIPLGGNQMAAESDAATPSNVIDVRYTVERINNVDYVTATEFQRGLQQAAQQGAQRGEQQTLKRLQMSSSTRKRLGL